MADWAQTMILVAAGLGLAGVLLVMLSACAVSAREEQDQQKWIKTMAAAGWLEWPVEPAADSDYQADEETETDNG